MICSAVMFSKHLPKKWKASSMQVIQVWISSTQVTHFRGHYLRVLDLKPAWHSASGSIKTSIPCHSQTFPFFATKLYSIWSPTCNWSREGYTTAVLLTATTLDSQISCTVLSYGLDWFPFHQTSIVGSSPSVIPCYLSGTQ